MQKEETLHRIKETEGQVRREKAAALEEREHILREARRQGFELRESLRKTAEKKQEEILRRVDASTASERERILATGRKDAEALRKEAEVNIERAVDRLIEKFKGAVNA
jgi:V/A-type H+-transporting ATPase subunit G/H